MRYTRKLDGTWEPFEPPAKEGFPTATLRDGYGRGEFLVTAKDGSKRYTTGWRDWRNYCKQNGLVEVSPHDSVLRKNTSTQKATDRLKAALPKAIGQAIQKVRQRPYFDRRAIGLGSKPSHTEIRQDIQRNRRRAA